MSRENEPSVRFGPSPDPEDEEPEVKIYEDMESRGAPTKGQTYEKMGGGGAPTRGQTYENIESRGAPMRGQIYENMESGGAPMRGQIYENMECGGAPTRGQIYENMERGGAATRAPPGPQTCCGPDRFKMSSAGLVLLCLVFLIIIGLQAYYYVFHHQEPSPGLCADGWQRFRCSCLFVSSERKNWTESRDDCETRKAHLVVIDSQKKQDYVRSMRTDEDLWIGLNYTKGKGWTWVTDSALSLSFWLKGTIVVNAERGSAAFMTEGGFWNYSLHGLRCWICEKEI